MASALIRTRTGPSRSGSAAWTAICRHMPPRRGRDTSRPRQVARLGARRRFGPVGGGAGGRRVRQATCGEAPRHAIGPDAIRRAGVSSSRTRPHVRDGPSVPVRRFEGPPRDDDADHAALGRVAARVHVALRPGREHRNATDGAFHVCARHARVVRCVERVVGAKRRGVAAVVHERGDRRAVGPVEPRDGHSVIHRPAVRAAVGADPGDVPTPTAPTASRPGRPGLLDRPGDPVGRSPARHVGRLAEHRAAVGMRPGQLQAIARDPGRCAGRPPAMSSWRRTSMPMRSVDDQGDRRSVRSLGHDGVGIQRIVDAHRAAVRDPKPSSSSPSGGVISTFAAPTFIRRPPRG